MNFQIQRQPAVEDDLLDAFVHIGLESPAAADRFLVAAERTFRELRDEPGLGRRRDFSESHLADLRSWRIRGFENWLIFYRPVSEGVEIIRVLHGARDLDELFELSE